MALGLGIAEMVAGLLVRRGGGTGTPSPLLAVGGVFVDLTPSWLKEWAVAVFGTTDKYVLAFGMGVTLLALGMLIGRLGARSRVAAVALFILVGLVAVAAVASRPSATGVDLFPSLVGLFTGGWVLSALLTRAGTAAAERAAADAPDGSEGPSRRRVIALAAALGVVGGAAVLVGQTLARTARTVRDAVVDLVLPQPVRRAHIPAAAVAAVPGQTTYVTPNTDFYRIDTALFVPQVEAADWRLRVTGMVDTEIELTLEELYAQAHVEAVVTLTCVSNTVGGGLAGNATWLGWPVRELLARAGVHPEADMVLSRSVDGFTAGTPLEVLTDERDALIAIAMNGEPLPADHGFPARLVVPGLYGYVSATKWLTELKVTRFDADEGYWTPRGWSEHGPVKTASRIDVPRGGSVRLTGDGLITVAGVAWAQHRGISRVEVRVDEGPWHEAELLAEPTVDAWRLWIWRWAASPGAHTLTVRATDGLGELQTSDVAPPAPDGATGWHSVQVEVD